MIGAVSHKVGFAGVQALGEMDCPEAISQLTRLRAKVKYAVGRRLIEKSLHHAAERKGLLTDELEDMCVGAYGLDERGGIDIVIADARARIHLGEDGRVGIAWHNADGKLVKSAPSHVKKAFPKEVRAVSTRAKEIEQAFVARRSRLEASFLDSRAMPLRHWRQYFIDQPLLGRLGKRLIWVFSNPDAGECSGLWCDGDVGDAAGNRLDVRHAKSVHLWHPLSSPPGERQAWRERIYARGIRQPFRQAFREFYDLTENERRTPMYSNRFAGILLRQHQLSSLCRARGWEYRLMGAGFDGGNVPTRRLAAWNIDVEFHVDLPPDRDAKLRDSALNDQSGSGINLFVASDQVRFYLDRREIALDEVPAVVYSEMMRDVDLFTSVCAVGEDETWYDQGDRGTGIISRQFDTHEIDAVIALRADILARVLPHTPIADRCKIAKGVLEVRGQFGTYRIFLGWTGAALVSDKDVRYLRVPRTVLDAITLKMELFPIELDYRTETALRQAYVLANDWEIDSPELIRQLSPQS